MTPRQREALDYIERYYAENRYPPTVRELMVAMGLASTCGAARLLNGLVDQGRLRRNGSPGRRRCYEPVDLDLQSVPTAALRAELQRREAAHG